MTTTTTQQETEAFRETVASAVANIVSAMEPQLNKMASKVANQALDKTRDLAQSAYRNVQRQPWYLVGAAALLLVGAALLFSFKARDVAEAT